MAPPVEVGFWMGVFVPAGTPKDLVDILNKQVAGLKWPRVMMARHPGRKGQNNKNLV